MCQGRILARRRGDRPPPPDCKIYIENLNLGVAFLNVSFTPPPLKKGSRYASVVCALPENNRHTTNTSTCLRAAITYKGVQDARAIWRPGPARPGAVPRVRQISLQHPPPDRFAAAVRDVEHACSVHRRRPRSSLVQSSPATPPVLHRRRRHRAAHGKPLLFDLLSRSVRRCVRKCLRRGNEFGVRRRVVDPSAGGECVCARAIVSVALAVRTTPQNRRFAARQGVRRRRFLYFFFAPSPRFTTTAYCKYTELIFFLLYIICIGI